METGRAALSRAAERVKVGEHLCVVYDRVEDQLATVEPFVRGGLKRGEQCVCVFDRIAADAMLTALRQADIDVDTAVSTGALVIVDHRDVYLRGGGFDPDDVLQAWTEIFAAAKASGFSAVRLIAEMSWVLGGEPGIEELLKYEAEVNPFLSTRDVLALCHYDRRKFNPVIIRRVLQTHPQVIFGGLVCPNPYYVPPEELLHSDADAEITRLLRNLVAHERAQETLRVSHQELQSLTRRLVEVQEAERRDIARELHDELGQGLTAARLILDRGLRLAPGPVKESLREAQSLLTELMQRVRELSLLLRPPILDELGLVSALCWYVDRYESQTRIKVNLLFDGTQDRRFAPQIETAAYRIVQEALTNVARHAGVREATVHVSADENGLHVGVEDRGVGFDPDGVSGAGLVSMRERAAALGGALIIQASPGAGVSVEATLRFGPSDRVLA